MPLTVKNSTDTFVDDSRDLIFELSHNLMVLLLILLLKATSERNVFLYFVSYVGPCSIPQSSRSLLDTTIISVPA
jgi:hypothetical protein